ncbi:hypothetical protein FRC04_008602 [Tulasnella sp. 424]|nr:hypothetical protein FRC04_008602 [Tulasnella sp. 424]KAG8965682.1 hypothetical protein FRC05_003070 [Tulasnella sp. 425]
MLFGQRPVSMFPSYTRRPEYSQPSVEEQYYRQLADDHNRRADAALRRAQQERERAAREREVQALRAREYQEELARRAHLRQQPRSRRPHSQFFGTPDFGSPFDFLGGPFEGQHPRSRAPEERRRRQSHSEDSEDRRFSAFLDNLFQHREEDAEEDVPVPKKARFDNNPRATPSRPQPARPETKAKNPVFETEKEDAQKKPTASAASATSTKPTATPAASSPNNHAASFASLDAIQSQFDALKAAFSFPSDVEFNSSASASSDIPKLTYASVNAPVHQYENELVKLLTKLDGVESDGAESIRGARKALVLAVEKELERVDQQKVEAWRKTLPAEPEVAPSDAMEADSTTESSLEGQATAQDVQASSATESANATERTEDAVLTAASVPLPQADDMELDPVSETADPHPVESLTEEASSPIAAPAVAGSEPPAEGAATLLVDDITSSTPPNVFADTPEAVAEESASESDESEESSAEAGVLVEEDSDSEVEAFIQVEESSPRISEAPLERDEDVEATREGVKLPTPSQVDDEDDFEML